MNARIESPAVRRIVWGTGWIATIMVAFAAGWWANLDEGRSNESPPAATPADATEPEVEQSVLPMAKFAEIEVGMTEAVVRAITRGPQLSGPTSRDGQNLTCWAWERSPGSDRALAVCFDPATKRVAFKDEEFPIPEEALGSERQ